MQHPGSMDEGQFRNFREFLETYNKISEKCFNSCVVNLNQRFLSEEEIRCADNCTHRNVNLNHRVLQAFMVEQPKITGQKLEKAQKEAEEQLKKLQEQGIEAQNLTPEQMAEKMMSGMKKSNYPQQ